MPTALKGLLAENEEKNDIKRAIESESEVNERGKIGADQGLMIGALVEQCDMPSNLSIQMINELAS